MNATPIHQARKPKIAQKVLFARGDWLALCDNGKRQALGISKRFIQ